MNVTIKPLHLGIAAGAIVLAIILLPFLFSAYQEAYPPAGTVRREIMDKCADQGHFRWFNNESLQNCLAFESVTRRR